MSGNRGATVLCLNYKTVKINIFLKVFCYNILLNLYSIYFLYKVKRYQEIKCHIPLKQILVNHTISPSCRYCYMC